MSFIFDFNSRVTAQISAEIVKPKDSRPNEGLLKINLELSPMAAQYFEANKYYTITFKT
jgi:exosome complex component RRP45